MSTFEAAFKSLLQGVSQQIPSERLPGQLSAQLNMMSDPVTNLRRRPGAAYAHSFEWEDATDANIVTWFTDVAGQRCHVLLNTSNGKIKLLDEQYNTLADLEGGAYLTTSDPTKIRAATVGNEFFIGNCGVQPYTEAVWPGDVPSTYGFFYIVAGAFGKGYTLSIGSTTTTYTTPSGSGAGDSAYAAPEYIAKALVNQLRGSVATAVRIDSLPANFTLQKYNGSAWVAVVIGDVFTKEQLVADTLRINNTNTAQRSDTFKASIQLSAGWHTTQASVYYTVFASTTQVLNNIGAFCALVDDLPELAGITMSRESAYVLVRGTGVTVNTQTGQSYMIASKNSWVSSASVLPARLPSAANGMVVSVGSSELPQYFKYDSASTRWLECAEYGSPTALKNMPVGLYYDGTTWLVSPVDFEGRFAGNDASNPSHEFITYGITGLGTYQGRLVILSGPMVSLSGSGNPRRFYRSTVTSVLMDDPIEIGSSMNSSAAYEHAIPFQKDLVLLSKAYQAVLPSGNAAISPTTATIVPTSSYEVDTTSAPIVIGRTLLYATPRSADFFGVFEMVPSSYTDSQYVSQDSTPHLPKYMAGRCRFAVSSSVSNMALFAPSADTRSLIVHEYHWDGDTKVQQSWHTWTFPYPVARAYFASEKIVLLFVRNSMCVLCTIDPRVGVLTFDYARRPFLDMYVMSSITDHDVPMPSWMQAFDTGMIHDIKLVSTTGALAGEPVGFSVGGGAIADTITTVRSHPSGNVGIGTPYRSMFSPTTPQIRDYNQSVIHSGKATLLHYALGTKNSAEFNVMVSDLHDQTMVSESVGSTLYWSSAELALGRSLYSTASVSIIPCRTDLRTTACSVYTDGPGELNAVSLEYVAKYHPKIKRR